MGKFLSVVFFLLISNLALLSAQTCNNYAFGNNATYRTCVFLPVLNSHLHWNYHTNGTVDVAFRHNGSTTDQWVAWALNVNGSGMIGAQSLVAITSSDGSVRAYTSVVSGYGTSLQPSTLSFNVSTITAERVNGHVVIYATLVLPNGGTAFNQTWQLGPLTNGVPSIHALNTENRASVGRVDFIAGGSRQRRRNTDVVLTVVSKGILMPIGVMIARYLKACKVDSPVWVFIHSVCQTSGFIIGIVGWAMRLKHRGDSSRLAYDTYRTMGTILFALGIVQVFALFFRPKPKHRRRTCWNAYHHSLGYAIVVLNIINVYEAFDILDTEKKLKNTYTGILITLGVVVVFLEAFRCCCRS